MPDGPVKHPFRWWLEIENDGDYESEDLPDDFRKELHKLCEKYDLKFRSSGQDFSVLRLVRDGYIK
jgi:hypothetical protein